MIDSPTLPKYASGSAEVPQGRWLSYLLVGIVSNAAIWGLTFLYLKVTPPTYTSEWAINVPVAGSSTNINLPGIGQAYSQKLSPYDSPANDPRENYKFITQSEPLLEAAANQLNMPLKKLGQPKIKIVENSTIIRFEVKGSSPESARNKSVAIYKALEAQLDKLREQEMAQQNSALQASLGSAEKKMKMAQKRFSEYIGNSDLNSSDQISDLSKNIEQLRRQRAEVVAQQQQANARLGQLSNNLNLSAQQAGDGFVLQTDPIIQKYLEQVSESNAALISLNSKFLPQHPAVIVEEGKRDAAIAALLKRAESLLGQPVSETTLEKLNPSRNGSYSSVRDKLSSDLVTVQADSEGLTAQAQALDRQIALLENKLKILAQQQFILEDLKRDVQTAEAVFSSTLTKLDLGKSSNYSSYPQIQILAEPSLPETPTAPKKKFALLGAAMGSLFCTSGLVLLSLRKRKTAVRHRVEYTRLETTPVQLSSKPELLNYREKLIKSERNGNNGNY